MLVSQYVYFVSGRCWKVLVHQCDCKDTQHHSLKGQEPIVKFINSGDIIERIGCIQGVTSADLIDDDEIVIVVATEWANIEADVIDELLVKDKLIRFLGGGVDKGYHIEPVDPSRRRYRA